MSKLEILQQHNFKFNHNLGQNFIFDRNLLQAIVSDAEITKESTVLEIGAGAGTLTQIISEIAKSVLSVEIDKNLQPILTKSFQDTPNVEFLFEDILKVNLKELENKLNTNYTIIANLPYYITTPIIFHFLENAKLLDKMVIMVQKEVAERINSIPGTKDYGLLTISVQSLADAKISRVVKRNMFTPQPNVDSAIVVITINKDKYNIKDFQLYKKVTKSAFAMRRKTLSNNLKQSFGLSATTVSDILNACKLPQSIRGESLNISEFIALTEEISKHI